MADCTVLVLCSRMIVALILCLVQFLMLLSFPKLKEHTSSKASEKTNQKS